MHHRYFCCSGLSILWICYLAILLATIVYCVVRLHNLPSEEDSVSTLGGVLFGILTAFTGAVSVTFSGPAIHMLKDVGAGDNEFAKYPSATLYVIALLFFACITIVGLNVGLSRYESTVIYPIYNVVNTIAANIAGLLYYRTYLNQSGGKLFVFFIGLSVALVGVVLLLIHRKRDIEEELRRFNEKRQKFEKYIGQRVRSRSEVG